MGEGLESEHIDHMSTLEECTISVTVARAHIDRGSGSAVIAYYLADNGVRRTIAELLGL